MVTLDTKLYRVNRDKRYGDLKTHPFLIYDIYTIIKDDGYTFIFQQESGYKYNLNIPLLKPIEDEIKVDDKLRILYFKTFNPSLEHLKTLLKNNGNYITLSKEELKEELAILLNGEIKSLKEKIAKDRKTVATLNKSLKNLFL